jgi:hypothetical protein
MKKSNPFFCGKDAVFKWRTIYTFGEIKMHFGVN